MTSLALSGCTALLEALLPEPHAGLLSGLLFGTKATLPRALYEALVQSGTLHIVALSGMNIAIISRLVQMNLLWLVGRKISGLLTVLLIVGFVWFVGPSASIVRAAVMGGVSLLAVLLGRQYWALWSWVLAVSGMLLINGSWLTDISFQLSCLATLGIILFGGDSRVSAAVKAGDAVRAVSPDQSESAGDTSSHTTWVGMASRSVKENMRLTLAAQVFTIPIILFHFHRISLISPISNLAIGWVIAPLTGLGWLTIVVGFLAFPVARVIAWVDWVLLEYIVRTVYLTSSIPFSSVGN